MRRTLAAFLVAVCLAAPTPGTEPRLAVFEFFSRFTGGNCIAAGAVVDRLATEMASRPVVFLEMNYDAQVGNRVSRWWLAYPGGTPFLPLVMVGSGREIADGIMDFERVFRGMVEREMARPPQAALRVWWVREGGRLRLYTRLTNLLPVPLGLDNQATVHALVWEVKRVGTTERIIRDAPYAEISPPLPAGATRDLPPLLTRELAGVDWGPVFALALVEWRPPNSAAFDQLQAARATPAGVAAIPKDLIFRVNPLNPVTSRRPLALDGPGGTAWTASSDAPWLRLVPTSGTLPTAAQAEVDVAQLASGPQRATLTVTAVSADGWTASTSIPVEAHLGEPLRPLRRVLRPSRRRYSPPAARRRPSRTMLATMIAAPSKVATVGTSEKITSPHPAAKTICK